MKLRLLPTFDLLAPFGRLLRRLGGSREGNVLILFAFAAIPVILGAGIALDAARTYMVKIRLAAALDAAALAVGSQASTTSTGTLTTDLNNYFYDNYCKGVPTGSAVTSCASTVAQEFGISVAASDAINGSNVTYTATANVPLTFMRLVSVLGLRPFQCNGGASSSCITVTVTASTTKFPGMEIAVVLDNTGSMLCNGAATSPTYSNCNTPSVTSGTNACASNTDTTSGGPNGNNASRICTLIPAANAFVTTLENAFAAPQSLYMSIVPYVTMVNVANALGCTNGSTTCTGITNNGTNFTDLRGNISPATPIIGNTTSGSTTISSVKVFSGQTAAYVSGSAAIVAGMHIYGNGIPTGTTVSSVSGTSITTSSAATLTYTANALAVGPPSGNISVPFTDPTTFTTTGTWGTSNAKVTVASTTGIAVGMVVTAHNGSIPTSTATTVSSISGTQVTLSAIPTAANGSGTNAQITFSLAGSATSGSTTISNLKGTTGDLNSIVVGMGISGTGIPTNAYVTSLTGTPPTSLTISAATTSTKAGDIVTFTNFGATTTSGSQTVSNVSLSAVPSVGQVIIGNGIPANTTISTVTGTAAQFAAGTGSLTISQNATKPSNFSSATGTCCNAEVDIFTPITYDSTYNSASPTGSSTTANWGGCVVEQTSSAENTNNTSTGVLNSSTANADIVAPVSGMSWFPAYWVPDSTNSWTTSGAAQDYNTETQGNIGVYDTLDGPNQGCPAALLPLTDLTTSAGQTTITNTINSMWPRDAGGTQVHVGMTWGWRVLDPNGPFAANNGHPLDYATANTTGWKKIVVLMTDGSEEWPSAGDYTGLGYITDGKVGTTSIGTAANTTNSGTLDTRLQNICTNMAATNIVIFTIALAADGQNNAILNNDCPANGGFASNAGPPNGQNLNTVFQNIASAIIHLRLTQ